MTFTLLYINGVFISSRSILKTYKKFFSFRSSSIWRYSKQRDRWKVMRQSKKTVKVWLITNARLTSIEWQISNNTSDTYSISHTRLCGLIFILWCKILYRNHARGFFLITMHSIYIRLTLQEFFFLPSSFFLLLYSLHAYQVHLSYDDDVKNRTLKHFSFERQIKISSL